MTQQLEECSGFYRYGLSVGLDMIEARLKEAQSLRKQQLAAIGNALSAHAGAVAELDNAKGVEELLALQAKLLRIQFEAVSGYWVGILQVAGESQVQAAKRGQVQAHQILEKLRMALGAVSDGSVPVMAALQPLVNATSSVYALAARATQETARRSADQWTTDNSNGKQASEHLRRKAA